MGGIPFGYVNEQLDVWDPTSQRHEDHVGHKIEWENDVEFNFDGDAANSLLSVRCDVLVKLHQGSHSIPDRQCIEEFLLVPEGGSP